METLGTIFLLAMLGFAGYFIAGFFNETKRKHHFQVGGIGAVMMFLAAGIVLEEPVAENADKAAMPSVQTESQDSLSAQTQSADIGVMVAEFHTNLPKIGLDEAVFEPYASGQEISDVQPWPGLALTVTRNAETKRLIRLDFDMTLYAGWRAAENLALTPVSDQLSFYKLTAFVTDVMRAVNPDLSAAERDVFVDLVWANEMRFFERGRFAPSGQDVSGVNYFLNGNPNQGRLKFSVKPAN